MTIASLAQHKSPQAAELLKLKAADQTDALSHLAAAAISGDLTRGLLDALADRDIRIRRGAAFAFLFINDPAAIPALRKASHDRDAAIQDAARWAVRRLERLNHVYAPN